MHLASADYGNQRDKCVNIHMRDLTMLNKQTGELVILVINDEAY
jgi:hypothetical protein